VLIGHTEWIKSLNISGSILISGGWDEIIYFWDIEKLSLVKRIKMEMGTITNIQSDRNKVVSVGREEGFQHQLAVIDFDRL
jgi:WD40 repeat protein